MKQERPPAYAGGLVLQGDGVKKLMQTVWSMTVLRIGEDQNGEAFVRIEETGEERRLYEKESLSMVFDLPVALTVD